MGSQRGRPMRFMARRLTDAAAWALVVDVHQRRRESDGLRCGFRLAVGFVLVVCVLLGVGARQPPAWAAPSSGRYVSVRLEGVVNPLKQRHVAGALARARDERAAFVLLSIDTPGGLITSMQEIVRDITNSPVPVVGFVEPRTAQASSAGAFILLATDIAAMAPESRVGAAHPVGNGQPLPEVLDDKVTGSLVALASSLARRRGRPADLAEEMVRSSRSFTAEDARSQKLVEIIATDGADLLRQLDGRTLDVHGQQVKLETGALEETSVRVSWVGRLLDAVADPTIAPLLVSLGMLGIGYELASPGIGMGGVLGTICLMLGLYGLSVLPVEIGSVILLIAGLAAIAVEVKVPSHGLVAGTGILSLVLGTVMLVDPGGYFGGLAPLKWLVVMPFVAAAAAFVLLLARVARRAQGRHVQTGAEALVGRRGTAKTALCPAGPGLFTGSVFVDGARWQAESALEIAEGQAVEVVEVLGAPMRLKVRAVQREASDGTHI